MMIYLVALLIAASISLLVVLVAQLVPERPAIITERLTELQRMGADGTGVIQRRTRQDRREKLEELLTALGQKISKPENAGKAAQDARQRLVYAGFRNPGAITIYQGARLALPLSLALMGLALLPLAGMAPNIIMIGAAFLGVAGYIAPSFYLDKKVTARQKDIQKALPDTLDLMVVCVEAGLGLGQAMMRVSDEIGHVSKNMSDELALVNLEIRAGTPREEALRHLGERSGVEDLRALTAMLIQTDRFGTSVATALRVQSDSLRVKRKQRAEEAAAKTAIKMLFPLVIFIFPSLFVVLLGPAMLQIMEAFANM
jgi:tight adherence protein C